MVEKNDIEKLLQEKSSEQKEPWHMVFLLDENTFTVNVSNIVHRLQNIYMCPYDIFEKVQMTSDRFIDVMINEMKLEILNKVLEERTAGNA
jgi:hypothetical protein